VRRSSRADRGNTEAALRIQKELVAEQEETVLYRHFDKDGRLLYVGISLNELLRIRQHKSTAPWWRDVSNITVERHGTKSEALIAERLAIEKERPLYNTAVLPRSRPTSRTRQKTTNRRLTRVRFCERVSLTLPKGTLARIDQVRGHQLRIQFIRQAIKRKLASRQKPKPDGKTQAVS
jgi:hypothetical protein